MDLGCDYAGLAGAAEVAERQATHTGDVSRYVQDVCTRLEAFTGAIEPLRGTERNPRQTNARRLSIPLAGVRLPCTHPCLEPNSREEAPCVNSSLPRSSAWMASCRLLAGRRKTPVAVSASAAGASPSAETATPVVARLRNERRETGNDTANSIGGGQRGRLASGFVSICLSGNCHKTVRRMLAGVGRQRQVA